MNDKNKKVVVVGDWIKFKRSKEAPAEIGRVYSTEPIRLPKRTENGDMIRHKNEKGEMLTSYVHEEHPRVHVLHFVGNATEITPICAEECEVVLKADGSEPK